MKDADPITLEVIRNALPAIANEMSLDLQRASYNPMIYETHDYCCALLNPKGELLAQNLGGVSHFVSDLGVVIRDGVQRYGVDGFSPGDVLITNHQRVGGQHLNNVSVYTPIFNGAVLRGFAIVRAHWTEIGGSSTGMGSAAAYDPWIEGLQLDQVRIYESGRPDDKVLRLIMDNIRTPEIQMGDLHAQIASCQLAERRLLELDRSYGSDVIDDDVQLIFDQTEERCRNVVADIPDGVYEAESFLSGGRVTDDPIEVKVKVTVSGTDMEIDLSRCSQQRREAINSRTYSGGLIPYKALTGPTEPLNEGSFRAVDVVIPEGNIMMARFPAPMAKWSMILPTVVDTVLIALAPAIPDRIPAGNEGTMGGGSLTFFGFDEKGKRFIARGGGRSGWGGRPFEDGISSSANVCQGDVCMEPIEANEIQNPIVVEERALVQDSGGPGKFRGGLANVYRVRSLAEARFSLSQSARRALPPRGLWGGMPGMVSDSKLKLPGDDDFRSEAVLNQFPAPGGTVGVVRGGGGGGWGDPLERDPAAVLEDLIEELISPESAYNDYGVVTNGLSSVDEEATIQRRKELRELREEAAS